MNTAHTVYFTEGEAAGLEKIVRQRGYASVRTYLMELIARDLLESAQALPGAEADEDDWTDEEILANLAEALEDVKAGRVMTVEEFEAALDSDDP